MSVFDPKPKLPRRALIAALALLCGCFLFQIGPHAGNLEVAQIGPGSGGSVPIGSVGGASSGGEPPPTCSNALDFSQACNSQYIEAIGQ
jgi:hypothetical protein